MKDTDTFQANPEFMTREIAGEVVLVPVGKVAADFNGLATLNKTGAFLWKLLEERRTISELCKALAAKYGLEAGQVLDDVTEFITIAQEKKLYFRLSIAKRNLNIDQNPIKKERRMNENEKIKTHLVDHSSSSVMCIPASRCGVGSVRCNTNTNTG